MPYETVIFSWNIAFQSAGGAPPVVQIPGCALGQIDLRLDLVEKKCYRDFNTAMNILWGNHSCATTYIKGQTRLPQTARRVKSTGPVCAHPGRNSNLQG